MVLECCLDPVSSEMVVLAEDRLFGLTGADFAVGDRGFAWGEVEGGLGRRELGVVANIPACLLWTTGYLLDPVSSEMVVLAEDWLFGLLGADFAVGDRGLARGEVEGGLCWGELEVVAGGQGGSGERADSRLSATRSDVEQHLTEVGSVCVEARGNFSGEH